MDYLVIIYEDNKKLVRCMTASQLFEFLQKQWEELMSEGPNPRFKVFNIAENVLDFG